MNVCSMQLEACRHVVFGIQYSVFVTRIQWHFISVFFFVRVICYSFEKCSFDVPPKTALVLECYVACFKANDLLIGWNDIESMQIYQHFVYYECWMLKSIHTLCRVKSLSKSFFQYFKIFEILLSSGSTFQWDQFDYELHECIHFFYLHEMW